MIFSYRRWSSHERSKSCRTYLSNWIALVKMSIISVLHCPHTTIYFEIPSPLSKKQSHSVALNSTGPSIFVRYNLEGLCSKVTIWNWILKQILFVIGMNFEVRLYVIVCDFTSYSLSSSMQKIQYHIWSAEIPLSFVIPLPLTSIPFPSTFLSLLVCWRHIILFIEGQSLLFLFTFRSMIF